VSRVRFAVRGAVGALDTRAEAILLDRAPASDLGVTQDTRTILAQVRREGDAALRRLSLRFDGVELNELEVDRSRRRRALDQLDAELRRALDRAAANIRVVHESFRPAATTIVTPDGVRIGRRPDPLRRAGVYVPGGRAAYASSLLMSVVPARVAGVGEIVVCSPPGPNGRPAPVVLAAAEIAGADRLFAVGGAGAIAAMAFGTASIPRVDRVTGPGNAWVAEAKSQVAGIVGVDAPAGPSELLVIADAGANAGRLARELAAQAEHDPRAAVVLVALAPDLARAVEAELIRILDGAPRATIIAGALASRGGLLTAESADEALAFAAAFAPEHLMLACRRAAGLATRVRNVGTIFIGECSSVVFGDYLTGANHVLPTGGAARAWSGLTTADFCRWTTWQEVPEAAARGMAAATAVLARAEGLPAHAAAAGAWSARP
jgi:histidinol dehydrogenase